MVQIQWFLFLLLGRFISSDSFPQALIHKLDRTFQILHWNQVLITSKNIEPHLLKKLVQRHQIASHSIFQDVDNAWNNAIDCDSLDHDALMSIFYYLTNHVPYTTLFIETTLNSCKRALDFFTSHPVMVGFYTLLYQTPNSWRLALTLSSGNGHLSHQDLDRNPFPNKFNLQGALIKTIGLPWEPWMSILKCNRDEHVDCEAVGGAPQVMGLLGHLLNFTWSLDRDPDGDWGTVPKTLTWMDENATFSGVLGGAVSQRYEVLMPIWARRYERSFWIDFADSMYSREIILIIKSNEISLDFTLFFRPFTSRSWLLIIGTSVIFAIILYAYKRTKSLELSKRVVILSGWLSFVLLNSFYGGALTMFFSSAPKVPFNTISEGLRSFPEWQMLQIQGDEVLIQPLSDAGVPEFKHYWEVVLANNPDLLVPDVETAVDRLIRGNRYFLFTSKVTFSKLVRTHPSLEDKMEILGTQMRLEACFGLRKHSPLRPILNKAIMTTKQSGVLTKVVDKWIDIVSDQSIDILEPQTVTLQQIGLILGLSLGILLLVTIIFFVELAWHKYSPSKR